MDEVEKVEEAIRRTQRRFIENTRARSGPLYTGVCLTCGTIVASPKRWCGRLCREKWMRSGQTAQTKNGAP